MINQFNPTNGVDIKGIVAGAALLGALFPSAADATNVFTCAPTQTKVISQTINTNRVTTSNVFSQIPETATTIPQGNSSNCVLVDFYGQFSTAVNAALFLSATIDGNPSVPDYIQVIANNTTFEARSANFAFPGVGPGTHVVRFLFRTSANGSPVYVNSSNIVIHYAP